jgi:hypothetical protein
MHLGIQKSRELGARAISRRDNTSIAVDASEHWESPEGKRGGNWEGGDGEGILFENCSRECIILHSYIRIETYSRECICMCACEYILCVED